MSIESHYFYEFGCFRIDPAKRRLLRADEVVPLAPKVFDTLLALVEQSGHTVEKDQLMAKVWPDVIVEENNLTQNISTLRKVLGQGNDNGQYIATIPKLGYRFVADVKVVIAKNEEWLSKAHTKSHLVIEKITGPGEDEQVVNPHSQGAQGREAPTTLAAHVSQMREAKSSAGIFLNRHKRRKWMALSAFALFVTASVGGIFIWPRILQVNQADRNLRAAFQMSNITRLTSNGNSLYPAISPDGKYIAYVLREAPNRLSIQLLHVETSAAQQILPTIEVRHLGGLSFSRDGNYLYFVKSEKFGPLHILYRIPVLGGVPTQIISDMYSYNLSPDGAQLAFVRNSRSADESVLMIANADGNGEYRLATRKLSDPFVALSWSPNGKRIAACVGSTEVSGERMYPVEVQVADGTEKEITAERWSYLGAIFWLADSNGLIVSGYKSNPVRSSSWHISYPQGEARRLTGTSEMYGMMSQTPDSKTMVAQTVELRTSIWVVPVSNEVASPAALARQITVGTSDNYPSYLPDGRILFNSTDPDLINDIWVMNADGTGRRQLTANAGANMLPTASKDGRYIVFESNRAGKTNIWRIDVDGGNPKQLTFGESDKVPDISPDSKWVAYTSSDDRTIWRVPIDGGEPQQITSSYCGGNWLSPDGKWLASVCNDSQINAPYTMAIIPFAGGKPVKTFAYPSDIRFYPGAKWTPNGQALIFGGERSGIANLWKQPITGGKPVPLTDFKSTEQIYSWAWSPEGKELVLGRGSWIFDILLIRNFPK